jgi:DNA-directed RNA polymerase subunit RPC12/RpoP
MKTGWYKNKKPSKCPNCGAFNWLTEEETKKKVHCQDCYSKYDYKEMKK